MSSTLTPKGEEAVNDVSRRFQLSRECAMHLLEALRRGRGTMAQFKCVEFGSGQRMQGGMIMVGDMFNHALKARVNEVFNELATERQGEVTVYDTGKHQIGGVSQQQGARSSVEFSSQLGSFPADSLPVVSEPKEDKPNIPGKAEAPPSASPPASPPASPQAKRDAAPDVAATLRKLSELHAEGLLSDEEFAAKRKQVIDRI